MKYQEFSYVKRKYPLFEFLDEKDDILFDISASDEGVLEIMFSHAIVGKSLQLSDVEKMIARGRELAEASLKNTQAE